MCPASSLLASLACAALLAAGCGKDAAKPTSHGAHPEGASAAGAAARGLEVPGGQGHLAAMANKGGLTLRDRPNGRVIAHLTAHDEYGSPTVVWAPRVKGRWLGVVSAQVPNNRLAWLDIDHDRPRMWRTRYSLEADLSERTLVLFRYGNPYRRIPVTIGAPSTPTPTGHFAVTDKLVPRSRAVYGCCIVALSGHQPNLRPGWAGGDRIAIHGSPTQATGGAASAGCLRARDNDVRILLRHLTLGTPVVIRA